jgi:folate-binding protein YgfZ
MTESVIATALPVTRLAELLAFAHPAGELAAYRGVLTPAELDAPAWETENLLFDAAAHDLGWRRRISVCGEDRFRWLSGMVTNAVNSLASGGGAWNLVLNAQGRIQGDVTVWRDGDALEIETAADQTGRLLAHLERFIIMDDVELMALGEETAVGVAGPRAGDVLVALGLPAFLEPLTQHHAEWNGIPVVVRREHGVLAPHYEIWIRQDALALLWKALADAGVNVVGAVALEAFRIAEGIPAYGVDIAERDLPQETAQLRALNFTKGCYLGQEIVERIRSRGNVHRHLRPLELTGALPAGGVQLSLPDEGGPAGKPAGHITSAAVLPIFSPSPASPRVFALGMVREEAELRGQPLTYTAGTATGTARILAAPPTFVREQIGNREP